MFERFVAIGDSFTEGLGDWNSRFPNGCRGWADRVAKQLAKQDSSRLYANLAIRSRRIEPILNEQLEQALYLKPTLVSFYAGGNDLLSFDLDLAQLLESYEGAVRRMRQSGAQVMLMTGFDVHLSPLVAPMKRRNWEFNDAVRQIAEQYGALLVDYWSFQELRDRRYWDRDRLHMSTLGHRQFARRVLAELGVKHTILQEDLGQWEESDDGFREGPRTRLRMVRRAGERAGRVVADEHEWMTTWVLPMFARRLRGVTLGDSLEPKWPYLIDPAKGMKRHARMRKKVHIPAGSFLSPSWDPFSARRGVSRTVGAS